MRAWLRTDLLVAVQVVLVVGAHAGVHPRVVAAGPAPALPRVQPPHHARVQVCQQNCRC